MIFKIMAKEGYHMSIHISVFGSYDLRSNNKSLFARDLTWHSDVEFPFQKVYESLHVLFNDVRGHIVEILILP